MFARLAGRPQRLVSAALLLLLAAPLPFAFAPALRGRSLFAFRDAAHYYYPLWNLTADRAGRSETLLWNSLENGGQPLLADSTAAVFYPAQLIFHLPLPFDVALRVYVIGHVLLAAMTMALAARIWRHSWTAAALAGLSYAYGGYVLFQHCNLIYLTGAAWLPLALVSGERLLAAPRPRWAVALAVCLAMMTLGGDAQTVYHLALVLSGYWILRCWRQRRVLPPQPRPLRRLAALLGALALAALLAAVQIVPSLECTRQSTRIAHDGPRNIWHVVQAAGRGQSVTAALHHMISPPEANTHDAEAYWFSVQPWRVAELAWPNFSGRLFPFHQRWTRHAFGEVRTWTASLYIGWLPLLLALSAVTLARRRVRRCWLTLLAVFSLLASFGRYGGVYWLLVVLLPGYATFRYPAKWLVLVSAALSLLAATGWDRSITAWMNAARQPTSSSNMPLRKWLLVALAVDAIGVVFLLVMRPTCMRWLMDAPPDAIFGPLNVAGALGDVLQSICQNLVISIIGLVLIWSICRHRAARVAGVALLLASSVDLLLAHSWQVATVPLERLVNSRAITEPAHDDVVGLQRVYRGGLVGWRPQQWSQAGSADRLAELVDWDHATLWPKHHLLCDDPVSLLLAPGAMNSADYWAWWHVAREEGLPSLRGRNHPHPEFVRVWGADLLITPHDDEWPTAFADRVPLAEEDAEAAQDAALWRVREPQPRAWLVRDVTLLPPLKRRHQSYVLQRTRDVCLPNGRLRDFRHSAVIETDLLPQGAKRWLHRQAETLSQRHQRALASISADAREERQEAVTPARRETCRVTDLAPELVQLEVDCARPALLVLADAYYPGWSARFIEQPAGNNSESAAIADVLRVNRVMRGVLLPRAGRYVIQLEYRPWYWPWCAWISGLAWFALVVVISGIAVRSRRTSRAGSAGAAFPS